MVGQSWSALHVDLGRRFDTLHERRGVRECLVAPRESAKTTHASKLYPLYCICYELEHYILLVGDTVGQSENNLDTIRQELENNIALRLAFPHVCGKGRVWNTGEIITRNGVKVAAYGRGSKVRGTSFGRYRPGLVVVDDLDNDESVANPKIRARVWRWFTLALLPVAREESLNVLLVGTIQHEDDTTQRIRKQPGWRYRKYQTLLAEPTAKKTLWAEWEAILTQQTIDINEGRLPEDADPAREFYERNRAAMDHGARLLWPEAESLYSIMLYRVRNGEASFQQEKQGNPRSAGAVEWEPSLFDDDKIRFARWPQCTIRAMVCDPSKGATEVSDYSAWLWGGIDNEHGLIYVDADLDRRDSVEICERGITIARKFLPQAIGMEEDNYGAIADVWDLVAERMGVAIQATHTLTNKGDKIRVRIRRLTPFLRGYRIKIRIGPGGDLLIKQLREFPTGDYDDGPDALEMLVRLLMLLQAQAAQDTNDGDELSDLMSFGEISDFLE